MANLKFASGIREACWDVELASHARFERACPIVGGMCAGAEVFNSCNRTITKAG